MTEAEPTRPFDLGETEFWDQYTHRVDEAAAHTATVYVRSLSPPLGAREAQESVLELVQALEATDVFDGTDLVVLGEQLCLDSVATQMGGARQFLATLDEIRGWTDCECRADTSFDQRQVHSRITEETYDTLKPPRVLLTVSVDGDMAGVFPCKAGDACFSVLDFLELLSDRSSTFATENSGGSVDSRRAHEKPM